MTRHWQAPPAFINSSISSPWTVYPSRSSAKRVAGDRPRSERTARRTVIALHTNARASASDTGIASGSRFSSWKLEYLCLLITYLILVLILVQLFIIFFISNYLILLWVIF
jgi:hypothetical protein